MDKVVKFIYVSGCALGARVVECFIRIRIRIRFAVCLLPQSEFVISLRWHFGKRELVFSGDGGTTPAAHSAVRQFCCLVRAPRFVS